MESLNEIIEGSVDIWWDDVETEIILDDKISAIYCNSNLHHAFDCL